MKVVASGDGTAPTVCGGGRVGAGAGAGQAVTNGAKGAEFSAFRAG